MSFSIIYDFVFHFTYNHDMRHYFVFQNAGNSAAMSAAQQQYVRDGCGTRALFRQ